VVTDTLGRGRENGACSRSVGMTNKKTVLFRVVTIPFMERRFSNSKFFFIYIFWSMSRKDCHAQQDGNAPELIPAGSKHE
jgi:hypothetical protein